MAERRARPATEERRARLLDATEEIMLRQGYAAVSSRAVAARVGINASLVHYYFPTLDDLFVAVLERRSGPVVERMAAALDSPEALTSWWEIASDQRGTALLIELMAAANHRPVLKAEVGETARRVRKLQMERVASLLHEYGLDPEVFPPALVAAGMQGVAFGVAQDRAAGYETAADEAATAMAKLLQLLEARRADRTRG